MDAPITAAELNSALAGSNPPLVIDVRRPPAFHSTPVIIVGAPCRDPATVLSWAKELPRASNAVVYCVHGHKLSRQTVCV